MTLISDDSVVIAGISSFEDQNNGFYESVLTLDGISAASAGIYKCIMDGLDSAKMTDLEVKKGKQI